MKRAHFIQSMLTLTGTAFVYGCKDIVEGPEQPAPGPYSSPTISGAKNWFTDSYVSSMESARTQKISVSRTFDWDNSKKVKSGKHDFIWTPVKYEGDQLGTALLMWQPGEEYIQKLAQYLSWSISEGFLAYRKPNGDYDGFLAQIAYDPTRSDLTKPIDPARFSGLVVNADLNENMLRSWRFLEGKMISYSNPEKDRGGRVEDCITYYSQYSTVTGSSCGMNCHSVTYTLHTVPNTVCNGGSGSDPGYMGSGANNTGDWYGYGGSGGGSTPPPRPPAITNYNNLAKIASSWERIEFNKRLTDIVSAVGIGVSTLDLSLAKATTIANALSLSTTGVRVSFVNAMVIGGKTVGGIGIVTSAYAIAIGIKNDGEMNWWGQDGLNALALTTGIIAVTTNPVGWALVGLTLASSGISVGMAIYDGANVKH